MRRRLSGVATATPPVQNSAPVQGQVMQTASAPAPNTQLAAPAATGSTALVQLSPDLFQLGQFQRSETLLPAGGVSSPFIGFHSQKANNSQDVLRALGNVPEGTPYISYDGLIFNCTQLSWLVLQELPHWVTLGADFSPNRCWLKPQPFGKKIGQDKVSEQMLAVVLVLPGVTGQGQAIPLPAELQPALATLTTFRATKAKAPRMHLDAVEDTLDPAWAREGVNGSIAAAAPPRFRIASTFSVEQRTAGSGFAYSLAEAVPATIHPIQMQALAQWGASEERQVELQSILEAFEKRAEDLEALAAETRE